MSQQKILNKFADDTYNIPTPKQFLEKWVPALSVLLDEAPDDVLFEAQERLYVKGVSK